METHPVLKIGYFTREESAFFQNSKENIRDYLYHTEHPIGKLTVTLADYLIKHSSEFDKVSFILTRSSGYLVKYLNKSEIDIASQTWPMHEKLAGIVDFSYPFKLDTSTFMTRKPMYQLQLSSIFRIFSLSIWMSIISTLIAIMLIYCLTWKRKYSFDKILLQVFAISLRQSLTFKPSSVAENLLIYSWIIGAMFFCLCYNSAFLSFLAIPPVVKINNVSQLAKAVAKGEYQCGIISTTPLQLYKDLLNSNDKSLRIIGKALKKNNLTDANLLYNFFSDQNGRNLAVIADQQTIQVFDTPSVILSTEHFLPKAGGMMIRKNFCCNKLVDQFVLRFMSSGLYFKIYSDWSFLNRIHLGFSYEERNTKRILTLTDVAPAFIILLTGYFLSFFVFLGEIMLCRRNKLKDFMFHKKGKSETTRNVCSA